MANPRMIWIFSNALQHAGGKISIGWSHCRPTCRRWWVSSNAAAGHLLLRSQIQQDVVEEI